MKTILLILTLILSLTSVAQTIFEQNGKYGVKDKKGLVVLAAEYDTIRRLIQQFPEAPYYELERDHKHGMLVYAQDSIDEFQWFFEACIYDSFVMDQGYDDDWDEITQKLLNKERGNESYTIDFIKDGKHHFFGTDLQTSFPLSASPFQPRREDTRYEYIRYFIKNPTIYDSVFRLGPFEMFYNEDGYKLTGFVPLNVKPVWYYTDSLGEQKPLARYDAEYQHAENQDHYPDRNLDFVSHIKDGKLSLINWLGKQMPYDFEPGEQFFSGGRSIRSESLNHPVRIFDRISLEEIHYTQYVGDIYHTEDIYANMAFYFFRDSTSYLILTPTRYDVFKNVGDLTYEDDDSHRFDIRFKQDNFAVINFSADTAIHYQQYAHRYDILDGAPYQNLRASLHERNKILRYDPFIVDYSLEGKDEYTIPFTLIDMKSGNAIGTFKLTPKFDKIIPQEPHFDTFMQLEYVEFYFERHTPATWIKKKYHNGQHINPEEQYYKAFAVYDLKEGKTYRSLKHWYKGKEIKKSRLN